MLQFLFQFCELAGDFNSFEHVILVFGHVSWPLFYYAIAIMRYMCLMGSICFCSEFPPFLSFPLAFSFRFRASHLFLYAE
jgi:hypothetical protein